MKNPSFALIFGMLAFVVSPVRAQSVCPDIQATISIAGVAVEMQVGSFNARRQWLDALFEAGCDDAAIGVGRPGVIALDFERNAPTREETLSTAIADVQRAISGCIAAD